MDKSEKSKLFATIKILMIFEKNALNVNLKFKPETFNIRSLQQV